MDKNLNTDCTENTDLTFSLIFLVGKWYWIYFQISVDSRVLVALPFSGKLQITILQYMTYQKGSAQALANPAKSKPKSKYHKRNIIKKWIREKTDPYSSAFYVKIQIF